MICIEKQITLKITSCSNLNECKASANTESCVNTGIPSPESIIKLLERSESVVVLEFSEGTDLTVESDIHRSPENCQYLHRINKSA